MMSKIAILALHMGYGGIEKSIAALANLLADKHEVEIVVAYKLYDKPVFELNDKIIVKYLVTDLIPNRLGFHKALHDKQIYLAFKEGLESAKVLRKRRKMMINYLKNSDADVIISTRDIFNGWLGDYAKPTTLKVGWEHTHYHNDFQYARGVIRSAYYLDYFVLVSESLRRFYSRHLANSNCVCLYIPNIIEEIPEKKASLNSKRLVSVGRLSLEKGYIDLLKVFLVLARRHTDWHLDIIGDGKEKDKLKKYIEKNELSDRITLHGFQGKDYIDKILNNSSIYIMTSYTESFGIVLIEAMSHGVPCIAFDSAEGAREIINSGDNGYLIKNRNFGRRAEK